MQHDIRHLFQKAMKTACNISTTHTLHSNALLTKYTVTLRL